MMSKSHSECVQQFSKAREGLRAFAKHRTLFDMDQLFKNTPEFLCRELVAYQYAKTIQRNSFFRSVYKHLIFAGWLLSSRILRLVVVPRFPLIVEL